ncbi:hypothetical protein X946_2784 [Burkholderia sp. ABCPW 111]|nr:hypothetical protein X946_2784 [Burkholderia sp. ABCPW 111]
MPREINPLDLLRLRVGVIPQFVAEVRLAYSALRLQAQHGPLAEIEIRVEQIEHPVHEGVLMNYTQPVTSMGAIHCRYLLEFLGLKSSGHPSVLSAIKDGPRSHRGDLGIEDFRLKDATPLQRLSPAVVQTFADPASVARAWATTIDFAGQRLAHPTDDFKLNGTDVTPLLEVAFVTVPAVVDTHFLALDLQLLPA